MSMGTISKNGGAKGRPKGDGKGRMGGRQKGTPNKVTGDLRAFVAKLIDDQWEQMISDLQALEPKDRLLMIERFMQYVIPKAPPEAPPQPETNTAVRLEIVTKGNAEAKSTYIVNTKSGTAPPIDVDFEEVKRRWNSETAGVLPALNVITDTMKEEIKARIYETSMDDFWAMISKVGNSQFLTGQKDGGWRADFGWCIKAEKYPKILNGAYDDNKKHDSSGGEKDYMDTDFGI